MASLYIKDPQTAELAARAANLQGKTKTQAVRDALQDVVDRLEPAPPRRKPILEWLEDYHRAHPLPPLTGLKADKAFYDSLNDEDDD